MTDSKHVRSWSAIGVGVFFSGVTAFVLLEDVCRHGAPLTTRHIMTLAVLAGTVYFGHALWRELRAWRLGTAFGCTVLFLAGTATCVLMSAGRNAEVVTSKALSATSANAARSAARQDRDEAKLRYQAALKAEESECSDGNGAKCQAKRITRTLRREEYDAAETKLRALPPEQIANADIRAAADLISRLPYVSASVEAIEALLQLGYPFLQSLFCEVGAIVGFSIGLGGGRTVSVRCADKPVSTMLEEPSARNEPFDEERSSNGARVFNPHALSKDQALGDLLAYIRKHGSMPSQETCRARWGVRSKGTVSTWMGEWEDRGLIQRRADGRVKIASVPGHAATAH